MKTFDQVELSTVANVLSGYAFKSEDLTDNEKGVPVLKIANVTPPIATLIFENYFPSEKLSDRIEKYYVCEGDVLVAMTGMGSVGRVCVVRGMDRAILLNQRVGVVRGKQNCFDQRFLGCVLTAKHYEQTLYDLGIGAGQPNVSPKDIGRLLLPLPSFATQKKIAAVLSAYDELIETKKRRIAFLARLAEEIYREWFVRLRFPGRENVKRVKGIPQGWRVAELRELATINPSTISRRDKPETILYLDISSVSTNRILEITSYEADKAPGRARRRVKHGDIIWSSVRPANRAYCLIYEPPENLIVSTGFAVIRPNASSPFTFLSFAVTSNSFVEQMTVVARGAAYPATSFDDFEKAKVLVPSASLLQLFHERTEPLFRQKHLLSLQTNYLAATRDTLLPRLISGKFPVENLDIQFPPGMMEELNQNSDHTPHA